VTRRALLCIATCIVAVAPAPWVLRAHISDLSIYVDQNRVDRTHPDTVGLWIRWVYDSATHAAGPNTPLVKRIEVHSLVRCADRRVRPLSVDVYDPAGAPLAHHEFSATDSLRPVFNQMVHNAVPAICPWLRDPSAPVISAP
jgi:hypothetical protein